MSASENRWSEHVQTAKQQCMLATHLDNPNIRLDAKVVHLPPGKLNTEEQETRLACGTRSSCRLHVGKHEKHKPPEAVLHD